MASALLGLWQAWVISKTRPSSETPLTAQPAQPAKLGWTLPWSVAAPAQEYAGVMLALVHDLAPLHDKPMVILGWPAPRWPPPRATSMGPVRRRRPANTPRRVGRETRLHEARLRPRLHLEQIGQFPIGRRGGHAHAQHQEVEHIAGNERLAGHGLVDPALGTALPRARPPAVRHGADQLLGPPSACSQERGRCRWPKLCRSM